MNRLTEMGRSWMSYDGLAEHSRQQQRLIFISEFSSGSDTIWVFSEWNDMNVSDWKQKNNYLFPSKILEFT